jgi:HAD superfamily hydrolase (TIGR01509 family)
MTAVLFGSIGTLADTSELQRAAFNRAFADLEVPWHWDRDEYARLLQASGGEQRIQDYAEARGETIDAAAIHRRKSEIYQARLQEVGATARPGVAETIARCGAAGYRLALVTTTSPQNVAAIGAALTGQVDFREFDLVIDRTDVASAKPDPDAYQLALAQLGETPAGCVAIEDNPGGVAAAVSAGVTCVAFPSSNNAVNDFEQARLRVDELSFDLLRGLLDGAEAPTGR